MSGGLLSPEALADELGITVVQVKELTRTQAWPCVRFSRKTIRYTPEQVEQIVAMHSRSGAADPPEEGAKVAQLRAAQTERSRRHRASS